jgi:hypothetical protein
MSDATYDATNPYGLGVGEYRVKLEIDFMFKSPPCNAPQAIERDAFNARLQKKADLLAREIERRLSSMDLMAVEAFANLPESEGETLE